MVPGALQQLSLLQPVGAVVGAVAGAVAVQLLQLAVQVAVIQIWLFGPLIALLTTRKSQVASFSFSYEIIFSEMPKPLYSTKKISRCKAGDPKLVLVNN